MRIPESPPPGGAIPPPHPFVSRMRGNNFFFSCQRCSEGMGGQWYQLKTRSGANHKTKSHCTNQIEIKRPERYPQDRGAGGLRSNTGGQAAALPGSSLTPTLAAGRAVVGAGGGGAGKTASMVCSTPPPDVHRTLSINSKQKGVQSPHLRTYLPNS